MAFSVSAIGAFDPQAFMTKIIANKKTDAAR